MSSTSGGRFLSWLSRGRGIEIIAASCIAVLLTAIITYLPKFDLVEAAMNDENFTDIVLRTHGDLPIDTNIRVVTYDAAIFDSTDRVDRALLTLRLAALMELKPRVAGVDFLIEDLRPEAPDGDTMLASLITDHPNLIFGIFHEDSLNRFRIPPSLFGSPDRRFGCINLQEDEDGTIRTYTTLWGDPGGRPTESFDLRVARLGDSAAAAHLDRFSQRTFVIDYAAGIGETKRSSDAGGDQVFPTIPLDTIFNTISSGDSAGTAALRAIFADKTVLVGYGDIRKGQVTSVVDRFYTPLRQEKQGLPDMNGVAIHANILNTILRGRIVQIVPLWLNMIWGLVLVLIRLLSRERIERVSNPRSRAFLLYGTFWTLFLLGVLLPILAFRYTPYKFSIYTPLAGLLLSVPAMEGLDKGLGLLRDILRRMRLRSLRSPAMAAALRFILKAWNSEERMERGNHFLQSQFHGACAILFAEAGTGALRFDMPTIASPTLRRMVAALNAQPDALAASSAAARDAAGIITIIDSDPELQRALRLARSLYVALNEIRRQGAEMEESTEETVEATEGIADYADLALKTLGGTKGREKDGQFGKLYESLERYARRAGETGGTGEVGHLHPYAFRASCRLHNREETFIYFGMQEDANNRDDFYDLVYGGATIRCQPSDHPGLRNFKEATRAAGDDDGEITSAR
ncbi:MAG: hypothetical protein JWQ98_2289 [Chlorobi bacterium]|nr:hypothetical protein [Chlorobiota bacterium]